MKAGIHPDYRTVLFHDTAADVFFLIGSTADSDRTHVHSDGNTYPYIPLDVSSASHRSTPASSARLRLKAGLPVSTSGLHRLAPVRRKPRSEGLTFHLKGCCRSRSGFLTIVDRSSQPLSGYSTAS